MEKLNYKVLIEPESIEEKVEDLARQLTEDYRGKDLVVIGVLRGAFIFVADLVRKMDFPFEVDFLALSSYEGSASGGSFKVQSNFRSQIEGRHVLFVEDIVDSGATVEFLKGHIGPYKPASTKFCTLLTKSECHIGQPQIDYQGFDIPNVFVVGYGLDLDGAFRNLPCLAHVLKE